MTSEKGQTSSGIPPTGLSPVPPIPSQPGTFHDPKYLRTSYLFIYLLVGDEAPLAKKVAADVSLVDPLQPVSGFELCPFFSPDPISLFTPLDLI